MSVDDSGAPNPPSKGFRGQIWRFLSFEQLITGPVIHLVYWAGLAIIVIFAFGIVGATLGVAWREGGWAFLLAAPALIGGALVVFVAGLLWRAFCEFYVAIFRIGDDLAALRRAAQAEAKRP
jgi:hypothetical protein